MPPRQRQRTTTPSGVRDRALVAANDSEERARQGLPPILPTNPDSPQAQRAAARARRRQALAVYLADNGDVGVSTELVNEIVIQAGGDQVSAEDQATSRPELVDTARQLVRETGMSQLPPIVWTSDRTEARRRAAEARMRLIDEERDAERAQARRFQAARAGRDADFERIQQQQQQHMSGGGRPTGTTGRYGVDSLVEYQLEQNVADALQALQGGCEFLP